VPDKKYEVILVNNDITDMDAGMNLPDNFKVVNEPTPGSYAARNSGILNSTGDVLAFIDADCIVSEDWLVNIVKLIEGNYSPRIAGHVELFFPSSVPYPIYCYEKLFSFDQRRNASRGLSVTANFITFRELFDCVGLFDDKLYSGGDFEWNRRATKAGYGIKYASSIKVCHPSRSTWGELFKKSRRVIAGLVANKKNNFYILLARLLFPPVYTIPRLYKNSTATLLEKSVAFSMFWLVSVYQFQHALKVKFKFANPSRV
jgi:glycosyltransferase involved in cell wall biosynthesis